MPTIDVVAGTAEANGRVRDRMTATGQSYLTAVSDEMSILARCMANEALRGEEHHAPWLGEYLALCLLRDRSLACHDQARRS